MKIHRREFLAGSIAASVAASVQGRIRAASWPEAIGESSRPLTAIKVGEATKLPNNSGDTWIAAWAGDDNLYSPSNDTSGFAKSCNANVAFNRIAGSDPLRLSGTTVNPMTDYGKGGQRGRDGCTWKSMGCIWVDGALYLAVSRHLYGEDSADPHRRQTAENASILKSTDLGKSWTRSAEENYDHPMFPGRRFATPYFIQYGYGHADVAADNGDNYVYAVSNNGFWDCGDSIVLGRVPRAKLGALDGHDWEYYAGGDGMNAASWSPSMQKAAEILSAPGRLGMTGAVYLAALKRYLMIGWYYPAGGGKMPGAGTHTVWDFYEAPRPWGPWNRIGSYDSAPDGWYSPEICPKFQQQNRVYAVTAGFWEHPESYRLTVVPIEAQS
jgi:hypothetical protein